ncbi:MAG TPA: lysylphosphatidylglycerol synthase transmembrane domain-containing protein [Ferruginibacter sp.]|nr:lysylphosphatidylglycerol synthase transmembrane domain-containing protein [Ferruginibacter sp.]
MRKKIFSILQYVIFLGGGLFLVWWQLRDMTPEGVKEFKDAFNTANYWLIIPIVIMALASHLSRSMRWKLLMEQLGYKPKLKNVFAVTIVGYLANSAVPRLGEILKCTFLSRYEKLKVDKLVGTILVERTFDVLCYLIFIAITVLIQISTIGEFIKEQFSIFASSSGMPVWAKLIIVVGCVIALFLLLKLLSRKYPNSGIIIRTRNFFAGIVEGFRTIQRMKKKKLFIAHTIFIWSMYLLEIYVGFQAIEATSGLGLKAACSVLTMATLAMIITPSGIGTFPLLVRNTVMKYGIDKNIGNAFGWLIWGVSTGIIIIAGIICLAVLPYINRKKNEIDTGDTDQNIQPA